MSRRLKNFGDWGEEQAGGFLRRHGFAVIERNYHTTTGEIDIVATKGGDYYFIEVKTRRAGELANDTAITYRKKMKFRKAVNAYCYRRRVPETGIIAAGLLVVADKASGRVNFRLAVW